MAVDSKWGPGCVPKRVAVEYFRATKDIALSLGEEVYLQAVAATACAAMANALSASAALDEDVLAKCDTILAVAQYVRKLARQHMCNEKAEDEGRPKEAQSADKRAPSPLAEIAHAMRSLRGKYERQQQQMQQATQARTEAASTPGSAPTSTPATSSPGLPLPPAVLPAILSHLDARSAAAAAASCRELRAAYLEQFYHLLPELFTLYVDNALDIFYHPRSGREGDSCEAAFAVLWPLDGSTACGADLVRSQRERGALRLLTLMRKRMPHVTMPEAPDNTRPAPSCYTSSLAAFKESAPVHLPTSSSGLPPSSSSPIPSDPSPRTTASPISPPAAGPDTAGPSTSTSTSTPSTTPAPAPSCSHEALTHACCDVRVQRSVANGHALHVDGDLLAVAYLQAWKKQDPGLLQGCVLSGESGIGIGRHKQYATGFYDHVTRVRADEARGLVWAAADNRRVKAFRAPGSGESGGGMALRHTLSTDVKGLEGWHAGLHVMGDSLLLVNSVGAVMRWEMARLQELEASPGVPPHAVHLLQLPVYDMSKRQRRNFAKQTALMADPASPTAPVLVAAMDEHYGNTVLTYDMETLRVRQRLLGHLYDIWDIAVPPPSWQGAPLFATTSWTGDVKLWDLRSRCCSPAVTLVGGGAPLDAVALVAAQGGAGQLGAGLMCFAGGMGEAVWAWDLRAGRAQALYELSTGNARVLALAWHQGSSSLLASCESMYDDCHEDWAGGSDGEGEGGSGSRWWPKRAKHDRKDFKAYWTEADSCVVQYRFSDRAGGAVPESQGPAFGWQGFE